MCKKLFVAILILIISQHAFSQSGVSNIKMADSKNLIIKIDTSVFNKKYSASMYYSDKYKVLMMAILPQMSYPFAIQDMEKGIKEMEVQVIEKKSYKKGNNDITYLRAKVTEDGKVEIKDTYLIKDPQGKVIHITSQIPTANNESVTKAVREAAESVKLKK
jgi:hypothetical protein